MYNEEIKQRFIDSSDNTFTLERGRKWIFDAVGIYESIIHKDGAEMDPKEAICAVENSGIEELSSVRQVITTMRAYTTWCSRNKVFPNIPFGFDQISIDDIDFSKTFREVLFKDGDALIDDLNMVGSFDAGTVDVMVFLLSWLGLFRTEMIALRDKDVDLDSRVIYGQDGKVLVSGFSDSVAGALFRYKKCQVSTRQSGSGITKVVKDNSVSSFLKRMLSENSKKFGTEYTVRQLESNSSHLAKKYVDNGGHHNRLTMANTWRSGCLYRLWQMEQEIGLDMGNLKRREYIEKAFRKKKNYTNAARMYRWYKRIFWE